MFVLFAVALITLSSSNLSGKQYDAPRKIIVAGKIDNYDSSKEVVLEVNRIGFESEEIIAKTDSLGNFKVFFESYIPTDAWLCYKTNFLVLLHPGDSIYVRFDGKYNDRPQILESIHFSGDAALTNQYASKFQQMYFSTEIYRNLNKKNKAVKEYEVDQYIQYLDTVLQKNTELYNKFIAENQPNNESKNWAKLFIEGDYYDDLSSYARNHRLANNMGSDNKWDVPKDFYDRLLNRLPVDSSMFICSHQLSSFSNRFLFRYIHDKLNNELKNLTIIDLLTIRRKVDEIRFSTVVKYTPDPLLRQIMLTEMFEEKFEEQDVRSYERFKDLVETHIKEPFLKEPLHQKYLQTKLRIENPKIHTEAVLKEIVDSSVEKAIDDILRQNKGKVIYIDFWATWCGACLAEMPNSKVVEHELNKKNVAFVYICLESEEERWKAVLDKYQIGGQHYLFSNKQSAEIRRSFEISGLPFYVLIDKSGVIKEKGSHLRPFTAKEKIKEMLK